MRIKNLVVIMAMFFLSVVSLLGVADTVMAFDKVDMYSNTSANWSSWNPILPKNTVGVESDTSVMKVGDGNNPYNSLAAIGSYSTYSIPTYGSTLTTADCGKTFFILADAMTFTLPTAAAGCKVTFINDGGAGAAVVRIMTDGTAKFFGTTFSAALMATQNIISSLSASTLQNTKSTAKTGDLVTLISAGTGTWLITHGTGTWTTI